MLEPGRLTCCNVRGCRGVQTSAVHRDPVPPEAQQSSFTCGLPSDVAVAIDGCRAVRALHERT